MEVKSILEKVSQALAGIQSLTLAECERAFNCEPCFISALVS